MSKATTETIPKIATASFLFMYGRFGYFPTILWNLSFVAKIIYLYFLNDYDLIIQIIHLYTLKIMFIIFHLIYNYYGQL